MVPVNHYCLSVFLFSGKAVTELANVDMSAQTAKHILMWLWNRLKDTLILHHRANNGRKDKNKPVSKLIS